MPATLFMPRSILFIAFFSLFFSVGCYKNYLYVQQEWIDREFLASSKVNTPDPRQAHPPEGQRLLVSWDFPKSVFSEGLDLHLTVRFWDNTEQYFTQALERKRDIATFYFPSEKHNGDKKILTYLLEVKNQSGETVQVWKHHFWTRLIQINNAAVSANDKQGSVIDKCGTIGLDWQPASR